MLDEDRIRVMTKLAVFENTKGRRMQPANNYYKSDYMSYHMIWAGIAATIAFILGWALIIVYRMEYYLNNINKIQLSSMGILVVVIYLCYIFCFEMIAWFIYRKRYKQAQRYLQEYCNELKELEKIYNKEYRRKEQLRKQKSLNTGGAASNDKFTGI